MVELLAIMVFTAITQSQKKHSSFLLQIFYPSRAMHDKKMPHPYMLLVVLSFIQPWLCIHPL